jgi:pyranose oxidase
MAENLNTDVLIVGSGPVACTFARLLHAAGRRVVMADSGPQMSRYPGEHLKNAVAWQRDIDKFTPIVQGLLYQYSTPPRPGHTLTLDPISFQTGAESASTRNAINPRQDPYKNLPSAAQGFAVGGMFVHWTNNTPRQHPQLERMEFINDDEWDLLYRCAEALLNVHSNVFVNSIRHQVLKERLIRFYAGRLHDPYIPGDMPMGAERRTDNNEFVYYTGSDTILGPLAIHGFDDTFRILPEHRVKCLNVSGGRVTQAIVDDMVRGNRLTISADLFVVAGGSVMTPQLLWNSGIRPRALGRYLHEHTFTFTQIVLKKDILDEIARHRAPTSDGLADPVPVPMHDPPPMLRVPVSDVRPWHTQVHRDSFGFNGVPPDVDSRLILDIRSFGMVRPREDNRVTFESDIFDKFGMPQPTFEYELGDVDRKLAHDMMSDSVDIALELGGFLVGSEPQFMPPGASLHVMGTTRMGEIDDGNSVIDPFSRVWGFENLFLGGNGVLAKENACNPTLTSVALAVRSATKITGQRPDPNSLGMGDYRLVLGLG